MKTKYLHTGTYKGDVNIGLFIFATDKYILIPNNSINLNSFGAKQIIASAYETELLGLFFAGNSKCLIAPHNIDKDEIENLKLNLPKTTKLHLLETKKNAIGNLILSNDYITFLSPVIKHKKQELQDALGTKIYILDIHDKEIISAFFVITNKGFLCSNEIDKEYLNYLKEKSNLKGNYGSVNFGSIFVKSGLLANSHNYIAGAKTTGPETARIDECLGFI
ncbi:MAG: hypothetical protein B6U87_02840 [Candidatus Aenigmarchaeota archaeon ex4484_52]|nr:MAG: hypothetical protein B6U87_02840 [Candidatus Aenigmarchaeota archaeon ex4484_52]